MFSLSSHHFVIPPVPTDVTRPLWSVMIPTYNCAEYLRRTLSSVLAQDPGPDVMQIEVIDDCSTQDDPAAVVAELGQGRVGFYRQPQNVGHTGNFRTCLTRSKGHLVHLLHGDDAVRPGFYQKMQQAFELRPEIGAAFCRHIFMNEQDHWQWVSQLERSTSGVLEQWLERIAVEQRIQTPSIVVQRQVYETLGIFDSRLSWAEDWEMWVRIAAHYAVWYETEPLALYRIHTQSNSGRHLRTGENLQDVRRAIDLFQTYLPETMADQLVQQALENWAVDTLQYTIPQMLEAGDYNAAQMQLQEALNCSHSPRVMRKLGALGWRISKGWVKLIVQRIRSPKPSPLLSSRN